MERARRAGGNLDLAVTKLGYGAAQAAAQSGDVAKARRYFARLVDMGGQGDPRPELVAARNFLTEGP